MRLHIFFVAILLAGCSTTQPGASVSPEQTVRSAFERLYANDPDGAMVLFHIPSRMPEEMAKAELAGHAKRMSSGKWDDEIIESKVTGKFAVVILNEKEVNKTRVDLDPIFLLNTPEGWKLSPEFTDFMPLVGQKGEGYKELEELMKWFKDKKEVLKTEMQNN